MGFYILLGLIIYVIVSYYLAKWIYRKKQNIKLAIFSFILIVTFPFWDLIVQKTIKTYYEQSGLLEPKIYAYPEKDKDGKIESLHIVNGFRIINNSINQTIEHRYKNTLLNKIKYLDFVFNLNKKDMVYRFSINNGKIEHQILDKIQSKYRWQSKKTESRLFNLYSIGGEELINTKTNSVLAESFIVSFNNFKPMESLRNIVLYLSGSDMNTIHIEGLGGYYDDLFWQIIWNQNDVERNTLTKN